MRQGRPLAKGNAYKDVLKTLRFLNDLVVTRPYLLVGEFHEFCRDNPSTKESRLKRIIQDKNMRRSALVVGLFDQLLQT